MKIKNILLGVGALGIVYKLGEFIGGIRTIKFVLDASDECIPGIKEDFVRSFSNKIIDCVFKDEEQHVEES